MSVSQGILGFKLEIADTNEHITSRAALPLVAELMRVVYRRPHYRRLAKALGTSDWQAVRRAFESLVLLLVDGGEHVSDINYLRADPGLPALLGFEPSSATQLKDFLYRFHQAADGRPLTDDDDRRLSVRGRATIREEGPGLAVLARMLDTIVHRIQRHDPHLWATLDVDATIVEAHKRDALVAYEGTRGYQPQGAWWAEQAVWVGEQFRDGNVPAQYKILDFVKRVFARLPGSVRHRRLRGDSALYDEALLTWLDDNRIHFAVSADMSKQLQATIGALDEGDWHSFGESKATAETETEPEQRQWAEVSYVPDWKRNRRKHGEPLRYIAIRVRSRQRALFDEDEKKWRHFAVVTNLPAKAWTGGKVLRWHRRKQGTVEYANGVIKNDLGGGVMPCGRFGANAAWWRLNAIVQDLLELLKQVLPGELELARPKTLRFWLFHMAGRVIRHARQWVLRVWSSHPQAVAYHRARETLARWAKEDAMVAAVAG